jgi:hypothetical protein
MLTLRYRRGRFTLSGSKLGFQKFETRREAWKWCAEHHPGTPINVNPIVPDAMTLDQAEEMALTIARLAEVLNERKAFHTEGASLQRAA